MCDVAARLTVTYLLTRTSADVSVPRLAGFSLNHLITRKK